MRLSTSSKSNRSAPHDGLHGPRGAFLGSVFAAAAAWAVAARVFPADLVLPVISTLLFVLAGIFALVAWVRCTTDEYRVTYWDVSGAIALIGICTATLIDPDQLVRLVTGTHIAN